MDDWHVCSGTREMRLSVGAFGGRNRTHVELSVQGRKVIKVGVTNGCTRARQRLGNGIFAGVQFLHAG